MIEFEFGEVRIELGEESLVIIREDLNQRIELRKDNLPAFVEYLSANIEETSDDRRIGFRILIYQLDAGTRSKISVTIIANRDEFEATLLDFGLTGMLVESKQKLTLDTKTKPVAMISFDDKRVAIGAGFVRNVADYKSAFHFPSSLRDGKLEPTDELISLFRQLEFAWLRNRVSK